MSVQILDIRFPSAPVTELVKSHQASVNCISWAPNESGQICTGGNGISLVWQCAWIHVLMLSLIAGDDNQVLVWDLNLNANNGSPNANSGNRSSHHRHHQGYHNGHQMQRHISDPILAYSAESEINSLCWNQSLTEWIGVGFGRTVQALRVWKSKTRRQTRKIQSAFCARWYQTTCMSHTYPHSHCLCSLPILLWYDAFFSFFFLLPFIDCLISQRGDLFASHLRGWQWNKNWSLQGINCLVAVKSAYGMHHVSTFTAWYTYMNWPSPSGLVKWGGELHQH